ncbi:hypothetical protein ABZU94_37165, partial [Streptomyces mirabilis]|uniref:hypothetical protein n=1 Tax=Streptomyces sp. NPDC005388 TaxID=3156717 RepID=UPI0033A90FF1
EPGLPLQRWASTRSGRNVITQRPLGATHERRILSRRARRLERAARHLLAAYQRTYNDDGVWDVEADELRLDYVIALEALLISPNDTGGRITANILSRAAALFLTRDHQEEAKGIVRRAYKARSIYVHGDVIKDQTEEEELKELRNLRLLTLQVILRAISQTRRLLHDIGHAIDPAETQLATLDDLTAHLGILRPEIKTASY